MKALVVLALLVVLPLATQAQEPDTVSAGDRALASDVAREIAALYNGPAALRATGPATIASDQTVAGDVAVLGGPLAVRGQVRGRVVVVNGNLLLAPGARITGDVIVTGGTIVGLEQATIGGALRWYPEALRYSLDGERIVAEREQGITSEIIDWQLWPGRTDPSRSRITIMSGGTYNRVEGLPILIGPSLRTSSDFVRVSADILGIMRSAQGFRWDRDNLGYDTRLAVRVGDTQGITADARLYEVVRPVETWQLSDAESGLATFLVRRDYRDWYEAHGGGVSVTLHAGEHMRGTIGWASERWRSRVDRDAFTLFRQGAEWRPNPEMDAGRFSIVTGQFVFDTRNDPIHPRSGWHLSAELERGSSDDASLSEAAHTIASSITPLATELTYVRGFLDLRRYNRVSPRGQLNFRAVLGGWLSGDDLPVQRRLSVGGAGSLPGYNFRRPIGEDAFTCGGAMLPGAPALCERVALAQMEYRSDLRLHWGRGRDLWLEVDRPASWVLFANAGRGWLVEDVPDSEVHYGSGDLPPLGTFRLDVGGGLDLGWIGVFVAKSVSDPEEPANLFLRLRHRF